MLSIDPIVEGTDRSTTPSTPEKSYLSGTLNRERAAGAGGGAATSAMSLVTLGGALDLPAHAVPAVHAANVARAQILGARG